jgi:hypothetical protein
MSNQSVWLSEVPRGYTLRIDYRMIGTHPHHVTLRRTAMMLGRNTGLAHVIR